MNIHKYIDDLINREGGYVNDPKDRGGETNFGITVAVAREFGYTGAMRNLPIETARQIYLQKYWTQPLFNKVDAINPAIAEELLDTGVNCGTGFAKPLLQRVLNLLNLGGTLFPNLKVDGVYGEKTLNALRIVLNKRGKDGERVILSMLNTLQGMRYITLAEAKEDQEKYVFGWFLNRVVA